MKRVGLYFLLWLVVSAFIGFQCVFEVMASPDPSARAVLGFLPFLIPIFMVNAVIPTAVLALASEACLWFWRRRNVSDK